MPLENVGPSLPAFSAQVALPTHTFGFELHGWTTTPVTNICCRVFERCTLFTVGRDFVPVYSTGRSVAVRARTFLQLCLPPSSFVRRFEIKKGWHCSGAGDAAPASYCCINCRPLRCAAVVSGAPLRLAPALFFVLHRRARPANQPRAGQSSVDMHVSGRRGGAGRIHTGTSASRPEAQGGFPSASASPSIRARRHGVSPPRRTWTIR